MSNFDFMPVGTQLIGDKISDTPIGEPQQEDWTQMSLDTQGPDLTPSSPPQIMAPDSGLVNPPP